MSDASNNKPDLEQLKEEGYIELPQIYEIDMCDPRLWVAQGWKDLRARPYISLSYGLFFAIVSVAILAFLVYADLQRMVLPALAGFMLMGPIAAIGLYQTSRCIECGRPCTLKEALGVRSRAPSQLMFIAAILLLALLSWMRIGVTLYAFFFGLEGVQGDQGAIEAIFATANGLLMLGIGSLVGGFIAVLIFSISVFSIPLLMVRDCDALSAIIFSIRAVVKNYKPLMLWGVILTVLIGFGFITGFLGFIVTFPLTAHASWHAFRTVVHLPQGLECEPDQDGSDPDPESIDQNGKETLSDS